MVLVSSFHKIGSMWVKFGLATARMMLARKRLCIKTNRDDNILEKFKIIVKGKSFVVRAKELFVWSPSFVEVTEADDIHDRGTSLSRLGQEGLEIPIHRRTVRGRVLIFDADVNAVELIRAFPKFLQASNLTSPLSDVRVANNVDDSISYWEMIGSIENIQKRRKLVLLAILEEMISVGGKAWKCSGHGDQEHLGNTISMLLLVNLSVPKAVPQSMDSIRRNFLMVFLMSETKDLLGLAGSNGSCVKVGNGMSTSFWHDQWLGDSCLRLSYPRLFALENNKVCSVAAKMSAPFVSSLRRDVRGGEESAQLSRISDLLDTVLGQMKIPITVNFGCGRSLWIVFLLGLICIGVEFRFSPDLLSFCCEALENLDDLCFVALGKSYCVVQNRCWKECFTLPGGVSGHIETISSSLIQIFENMVFLKT
ncbi:hypothetical protein Tco_1044259 [Tanacetum coccineum]|uniref:Uncharacterized protein n=1 Tax=Tanacetum coccineum TaxID=301880 RepID=A0ABQ5GQG7_9ASTR